MLKLWKKQMEDGSYLDLKDLKKDAGVMANAVVLRILNEATFLESATLKNGFQILLVVFRS